MVILDGYWTKEGTMLKMLCNCGATFDQKSWRRKATCPKCGRTEDLFDIRERDEEKMDRALGIQAQEIKQPKQTYNGQHGSSCNCRVCRMRKNQ